MPHMSPNIKARKGRLGAGGTYPDLNILTSVPYVTQGVGDTGFTASASDAVDGDITAAITWTSDLDGVVGGPGGTPTLTFTTLGAHVLTVSVTAPTGGQTTTVDLNVTVNP